MVTTGDVPVNPVKGALRWTPMLVLWGTLCAELALLLDFNNGMLSRTSQEASWE